MRSFVCSLSSLVLAAMLLFAPAKVVLGDDLSKSELLMIGRDRCVRFDLAQGSDETLLMPSRKVPETLVC